MRLYVSIALIALQTSLTSADAVHLSDFTPRVQNLPEACESVYTSSISGCSSTDFTGTTCSVACVNALDDLKDSVKTACGNQGIEGTNIVVAYLANQGPGQLCRNAADVLASESSASAAATSQSTEEVPSATAASTTSAAAATSSTDAATPATTTTVAETSTTSVATLSSSASSSSSSSTFTTPLTSASTSATSVTTGSVTIDTSSTPIATSPSSSPPSDSQSQTNYDDGSGGGSPFDTQGNLHNAASATSVTLSLGLATLGMVLLSMR